MEDLVVRNSETEAQFIALTTGLVVPATVQTDEEYEALVASTKQVKALETKVVDYFAAAKKKAHDMHKAVCDEEAKYLNPIKRYMTDAKREINGYLARKEAEKRRKEEELRALARKEAERIMAEAAAREKNGEDVSAMVEEAVITEAVGNTIKIETPQAKPGVTVRKDWKITNISYAEVPCEIAGVMIRPVDEAAVMRLIRATKGTIKIPGIEFEETQTISVRG